MTKDHGTSIKDDDAYEALRDDGYSKESAARIANARARGDDPGAKGGAAQPYEQRTKDELYELAQERDIEGRSSMSKSDLVKALRNAR